MTGMNNTGCVYEFTSGDSFEDQTARAERRTRLRRQWSGQFETDGSLRAPMPKMSICTIVDEVIYGNGGPGQAVMVQW